MLFPMPCFVNRKKTMVRPCATGLQDRGTSQQSEGQVLNDQADHQFDNQSRCAKMAAHGPCNKLEIRVPGLVIGVRPNSCPGDGTKNAVSAGKTIPDE
jgi:hypothetical protein